MEEPLAAGIVGAYDAVNLSVATKDGLVGGLAERGDAVVLNLRHLAFLEGETQGI